MAKLYNSLEHSVVQALLKPDATNRYEVSDFVHALVAAIHSELALSYWNWHQKKLEDRDDWQLLDVGDGFKYRRYCWGDCDCGAEEKGTKHLPTCSPGLPNLEYDGVIVNWYKYIGRGMSTNLDYDERQWRVWFDKAMATIRLYNVCMQACHKAYRDTDAGRKQFSTEDRTQCKNCKYCLRFGPNKYVSEEEARLSD
jgi:hypothetical protein